MIKFTSLSSEHVRLPENLIDKSEMNKNNYSPEYENAEIGKDLQAMFYCKEKYVVYCTYAWIKTDEIDSEEFPIAVLDYKPKYSKRTTFIFKEPIWKFMQDERTSEQQKFMDQNFDKLNELYLDFARSQGYL